MSNQPTLAELAEMLREHGYPSDEEFVVELIYGEETLADHTDELKLICRHLMEKSQGTSSRSARDYLNDPTYRDLVYNKSFVLGTLRILAKDLRVEYIDLLLAVCDFLRG